MIRQSDGVTFTEDVTNCSGADSTILGALTCTIPQATLEAAPYLLNFGDDVYATVSATNIKGQGVDSDAGTGA